MRGLRGGGWVGHGRGVWWQLVGAHLQAARGPPTPPLTRLRACLPTSPQSSLAAPAGAAHPHTRHSDCRPLGGLDAAGKHPRAVWMRTVGASDGGKGRTRAGPAAPPNPHALPPVPQVAAGVVLPADPAPLHQGMHAYLASCGIDGVKVHLGALAGSPGQQGCSPKPARLALKGWRLLTAAHAPTTYPSAQAGGRAEHHRAVRQRRRPGRRPRHRRTVPCQP